MSWTPDRSSRVSSTTSYSTDTRRGNEDGERQSEISASSQIDLDSRVHEGFNGRGASLYHAQISGGMVQPRPYSLFKPCDLYLSLTWTTEQFLPEKTATRSSLGVIQAAKDAQSFLLARKSSSWMAIRSRDALYTRCFSTLQVKWIHGKWPVGSPVQTLSACRTPVSHLWDRTRIISSNRTKHCDHRCSLYHFSLLWWKGADHLDEELRVRIFQLIQNSLAD